MEDQKACDEAQEQAVADHVYLSTVRLNEAIQKAYEVGITTTLVIRTVELHKTGPHQIGTDKFTGLGVKVQRRTLKTFDPPK